MFKINTSEDEADVHPTRICLKCVRKCNHAKNDPQRKDAYLSKSIKEPVEFKPHSRTSPCNVCEKLQASTAGGNKHKKAPHHLKNPLPFPLSATDIFECVKHHDLPMMASRDTADLATREELKHLYKCNGSVKYGNRVHLN